MAGFLPLDTGISVNAPRGLCGGKTVALGVTFCLIALFSCREAPSPQGPAAIMPSTGTRHSNPAQPLDSHSPRIDHSPSQGLFWIDGPDEEVADLLLKHMDADQILGQVFLLGWQSELAEGPVMDWIRLRGIGGVKVFGWNGNSVSTLAATLGAMQSASMADSLGIPLITATDQEGGWVRHIKDTTSSSPGNLAVGATDLPYDAFYSSQYIAQELRLMGVNMNFAPTVDVYTDPEAHVIGPRSYGSDPKEVSRLSIAAYEGMEDQRVAATAKHFPGHGNAVGDSHGTMPIVKDNLDTLWNRDLLPYRDLIPLGLPAILVGHLAFPEIDPEGRPASLSRKLNHELLREKLGFQGLVMTDDLYMGGAWEYGKNKGWKLSDIVLEALMAGNDMVMLSRTPEFDSEIWKKLKNAYESDQDFKTQIKASARRILLLKLRYLKKTDRVPLAPSPQEARSGIPAKGAADFFEQQSARAISWVKGSALDPKDLKGKRILIASQDGDFIRAGTDFFPQAQIFRYEYEPFYSARPEDLAGIKALAPDFDLIIFCLANPNSAQVLQSLKPWADKVSVISTLTPVYLKDFDWITRAVAVFGWERISYRYGFAALMGQYQAHAKVPLRWFQ